MTINGFNLVIGALVIVTVLMYTSSHFYWTQDRLLEAKTVCEKENGTFGIDTLPNLPYCLIQTDKNIYPIKFYFAEYEEKILLFRND